LSFPVLNTRLLLPAFKFTFILARVQNETPNDPGSIKLEGYGRTHSSPSIKFLGGQF
jgi:hypothetical protein